MEKGYSPGKMEENTKEIISRIKSKAMECFHGLMEDTMKDFG